MFYRQVTTVNSLENLPPEAVLYFDGLAAIKSANGDWLIAGEKTPVSSKILHTMSPVFHVVSEFSYYPSTGYNTGRVNLTKIQEMLQRYGEMNWIVLFEWTRDFFGVPFDTARAAVWALVKTGKIEPTDHDTLKLKR